MHQLCADRGGGPGKVFRPLMIGGKGGLDVLFGPVDSRIGRSIDDQIWRGLT